MRKWLLAVLVIASIALLVIVVPTSAAPNQCSIVHIVQRGETLYSIARRYGVSMWAIANTNGIVNPNIIYVGQRLVIPTCRPVGVIHVVQRGETLYSIARRYGVSVWAIARVNNLPNINYIYVGQYLSIPSGAPAPAPQPTPSGTLPGPWHGEYFDNVSLTGSPYVTRDDGNISYNWGYGPPAGGMPTNYFSVRWTGTFHLDPGNYRFYAKVDDGVRVWVDDELVIDSWREGAFRTYTADRWFLGGDHSMKVEYFDSIQVAKIYFWWEKLSGPTPTPGPTSTPGPSPTPGGTVTPPTDTWYGEYFNNEELEGDPAATRNDAWIAFDWGTSGPMPGVWPDGFSARWRRKLHLGVDNYRFCAMSDDGVRIWVGDELLVDEWHASPGLVYCATYWVSTGYHEIKVEYYEHGGDALIYVWWDPT